MPHSLKDVMNDVSPETREALKKALKEGDICYQRLRHTCGYVGNCFEKNAEGVWVRRTHCPQCKEEIVWTPIEEWVKRVIENTPGAKNVPEFRFGKD